MQLVIHSGAHFTEEDRLMKCLLRNADEFGARGIAVPPPARYRKLIRETLNAMRNAPASDRARDILMDAILDRSTADRVILSQAHIFGVPRAAFRAGILYPAAPERLNALSSIFEHDDIELFMAIKNPATLLPDLFAATDETNIDSFLGGANPLNVRWSDTLERIRQSAPNIPVTVWCNEDAPLIWAQIIRDLAGLEHGEKITGGFDLMSAIMSVDGMQRFRAYLKSHPVMTEMQKRRVIAAFLDKFALEDEIEVELDLPGWTEERVEQMTEIYDDDVFKIARIPGVTLLGP
jgi:hypothetical protein